MLGNIVEYMRITGNSSNQPLDGHLKSLNLSPALTEPLAILHAIENSITKRNFLSSQKVLLISHLLPQIVFPTPTAKSATIP
jgi:hypothetical protein